MIGFCCQSCRFGLPVTDHCPVVITLTEKPRFWWSSQTSKLEWKPVEKIECRRFPEWKNFTPEHWCGEYQAGRVDDIA